MTVIFQNPRDEEIITALAALADIQKEWFAPKDVKIKITSSTFKKLMYNQYLKGNVKLGRGTFRYFYSLTESGRNLSMLSKQLLKDN